MESIRAALFSMRDEKYVDFTAKINPTVDKSAIIGVRTPALREYARSIRGTDEAGAFLAELPHEYFDENQLHAFLLDRAKPFEYAVAEVERFLPYVDNWATCDVLSPAVFKKNTDKLMEHIEKWIISGRTYTVRFAIEMLMNHYLDEKFYAAHLEKVAAVESEEYYVNMMRAWYFATALAKQPEAALAVITSRRLDAWTHNKSIQKAVESYRISNEMKELLRSNRIK